MGARGNSGVILSQIVRGFAEVLGEAPTIDSPTLARAFRSASDAAYRAVRKPVEGTMLTVIRELAEEAEAQARSRTCRSPTCCARSSAAARTRSRARRSTSRSSARRASSTPAARGCSSSSAALTAARHRRGAARRCRPSLEDVGFDAVHQELSQYRYCTVFVVEGEGLDRDGARGASSSSSATR